MQRSGRDPFRQRAASYAAAGRARPDARARERGRLLDDVAIAPGMTVCDLQAAGGYVGEGVHERFGDSVRVVAVEPSATLVRTLPPGQHPAHAELAALPLRSGSIDVVLCLAGTHHSPRLEPIVAEVHRVLRRGGQLAICEVESGSDMDSWLNGFVDHWLPDGHAGRFVEPGELTKVLEASGFDDVAEQHEQVPWSFADADEMLAFCRELFGLAHVPAKVLGQAIHDLLPVASDAAGTRIDWCLRYAAAGKP